jgi:2-desacetyl-2-hydroxyethyl bacteriochlorophyllide A dehydrogenase
MEMMRRAVITGPRMVEIQELPWPAPASDEVVVRIHYSALCTFEQRAYTGADTRFYPLLGGHEMAGIVEAVGEDVLNVKVGDKVAVSALERCGSCYSCRRGKACDNVWFKRPGAENSKTAAGPAGLATHKLAKGYQVYKLDSGTDLLAGSLTEPLACVLRSIKKADIQPGDTVAVIGGGVMGLLHTMLARGRGAVVILSEPHPKRRRDSLNFGANHAINPLDGSFIDQVKTLTDGRGADVVIVAAGVVQALQDAIGALNKGGRLQVYARMYPKGATVTVDPNLLHDNEIVLTGTVSQSREDFQQAAEMIGRGAIDLRPIISATFPLDKMQAAFEASVDLNSYRVIINA